MVARLITPIGQVARTFCEPSASFRQQISGAWQGTCYAGAVAHKFLLRPLYALTPCNSIVWLRLDTCLSLQG